MDCPFCCGATKVIDSRRETEGVRRRRECLDCGYRFTTMEFDYDLYKHLADGQTVTMKVQVQTFKSGIAPIVACELI